MLESVQTPKELEVQEKQEVTAGEEQADQTRYYRPLTDIYETPEALVVVMEMPGVEKSDLNVRLEQDQLTVEGRISLAPYNNLKPLYTEYGVGHYARRFRLSNAINKQGIAARVENGVLTLTMPKVEEAATKSIEIH